MGIFFLGNTMLNAKPSGAIDWLQATRAAVEAARERIDPASKDRILSALAENLLKGITGKSANPDQVANMRDVMAAIYDGKTDNEVKALKAFGDMGRYMEQPQSWVGRLNTLATSFTTRMNL